MSDSELAFTKTGAYIRSEPKGPLERSRVRKIEDAYALAKERQEKEKQEHAKIQEEENSGIFSKLARLILRK